MRKNIPWTPAELRAVHEEAVLIHKNTSTYYAACQILGTRFPARTFEAIRTKLKIQVAILSRKDEHIQKIRDSLDR